MFALTLRKFKLLLLALQYTMYGSTKLLSCFSSVVY